VLVVDDDPQLRRFLRTTLAGHGHVVVEAGTVVDAIAAIQRTHPAVVLLDLGLPDGDGLAVVRAIPAEQRPPIIVLSAQVPRTT
jgi:two-component system KDP operon response regulator KdpE